MHLSMFLGSNLIDSVEIHPNDLHNPHLIRGLKIEMQENNEEIIDLAGERPQFFIENVPSSINLKRFQKLN